MSNQSDKTITELNHSDDGILADAYSTITDLITGSSIPKPVKKNAFKAFGQLCSVMIDIPVSWLEGIAEENRAETRARMQLIEKGTEQIAQQMAIDPEYSQAAAKKYGKRIVREQINLDKICATAAQQVQQSSTASESNSTSEEQNTEPPKITDDWLNSFEKEASQKSSEEMQLLFARILAGEIQRPSSFSIRTVKLLGSLDQADFSC